MKFILGKKLEMTQIFKDDKVTPVTLIEAGPCFITQLKRKEKDGYTALQVGFEKLKPNKVKKTQKDKPYRYLREVKVDESEIRNYELGQKIDASIFKKGEKVKVSGISKGKGFQGAVKRWGFSGRNATHGVKHEHRTLGSVGVSDAERVFKGKKMPGRMGGERVTVKNLEIVKVDPENNLIAVKGAVPGRRGTLLEIRS
jgi:large subunit ribosomal protein L3